MSLHFAYFSVFFSFLSKLFNIIFEVVHKHLTEVCKISIDRVNTKATLSLEYIAFQLQCCHVRNVHYPLCCNLFCSFKHKVYQIFVVFLFPSAKLHTCNMSSFGCNNMLVVKKRSNLSEATVSCWYRLLWVQFSFSVSAREHFFEIQPSDLFMWHFKGEKPPQGVLVNRHRHDCTHWH